MRKKLLSPILLVFALTTAVFAQTEVFIGLTAGPEYKKTAIAINNFIAGKTDNQLNFELALKFQEIIRADLMYSRYFDIKDTQNAPASSGKEAENFWKTAGAAWLITGKATQNEKVWTFNAQLKELQSGGVVIDKFYQGEPRAMRRAAHIFADSVIESITGKKGLAHSKIAFSNSSTGTREIYVVDYDGENLTKLSNDRSLALLPRWSPDSSKIYYTTYRYGNPDIFEIDLKAGKIKPFTAYQGLNIPGGLTPDGKTLALTLSRGGDPNIYTLNMITKELKKLLSDFGVNASPTYSPDGKEISFVSDRAGNPQIFILNTETLKTRKITRLNWCDSPSWSPSGEWIVFAGRETPKENLNIFLTDPTGGQIRRLTSGSGDNEDPSWSPDGRFIAFTSTRRGRKELFVMDSDGSAPHPLTELKGSTYTPSWSK